MRSLIRKHWPILLLVILTGILFWTNYTPGTWLTGWDNLHPELDFKTNIIDRSVFGVWQEYQGLGILAGNAHSADLLRQIGLLFVSFILPQSVLRYFYQFFALLTGALGLYFLLKYQLLKIHNEQTKNICSFIGSVFYILNLGTVQNFYVPYEAFSHFYASLPWLLFALFKFLEIRTNKAYLPAGRSTLFFLIANILAIPAFYIPTLFIVYMLCIGLILGMYVLNHWDSSKIKTALFVLFSIIMINAYWLLPFGYFFSQGTKFVTEAKINRMFTDEAFLRNQEFGTILNVPLLKGFLFDTTDLVNNDGQNAYMMAPWIAHMKPFPLILMYSFFISAIGGMIYAVKKKIPYASTILAIFILSLFALINDNPPTGFLFKFLQSVFPLIKQVFRFPDTKFIVPLSLSLSLFFSFFTLWIITHLKNIEKIMVTAILTILVVGAYFPSFKGNFIYPYMRVQVPQEYSSLFSFFKTVSPGRIADFPQPSFWGWTSYDWGYRGSGFPWYGIPYPMTDRAFDVWSPHNEEFYREASNALYSNNDKDFLNVLSKYDITYIWIDEHVIFPSNPAMLYYDGLKKMLSTRGYQPIFTNGKQSVYQIRPPHEYVSIMAPQKVETGTKFISYDQTFMPYGNYYTGKDSLPTHSFVFSDIDGANTSSLGLQTKANISGTLFIPSDFSQKGVVPATGTLFNSTVTINAIPTTLLVNGKEISPQIQAVVQAIPFPLSAHDLVQVNNTVIQNEKSTPLSLNQRNNLTVYDNNGSPVTDITKSIMDTPLENCQSDKDNTSIFANGSSGGVINLFGSNSKPCIYNRIMSFIGASAGFNPNSIGVNLMQDTQIIQVDFDYKSKTDEKPTLCLSKEGEIKCFFEAGKELPASQAWQHAEYQIPVDQIPLDKVWMKLELNASHIQKERGISLKNVQATVYQHIKYQTPFSLPNNIAPKPVQVKKGDTIQVALNPESFPSLAIDPSDLPLNQKNCFTLGTGTSVKTVMTDRIKGPFVRFDATHASSCDYYALPSLSNNPGFITTITSRNISGRPIKFSLKIDPPGYYLFEDILFGTTKDWTQKTYITPFIPGMGNENYFIELDDYAVGEERRINDIQSIVVTPFPYSWVKSLYISSDNQPIHETTTTSDITDAKRINPSLYRVNITQKDSSMLVLSQNYASGWHAYTNTHFWKEYLPFFMGTPLKEHVTVNNWENGWKLTNLTSKDTTVYIVYLPQYLEFIGFLLLFSYMSYMTYTSYKSYRN